MPEAMPPRSVEGGEHLEVGIPDGRGMMEPHNEAQPFFRAGGTLEGGYLWVGATRRPAPQASHMVGGLPWESCGQLPSQPRLQPGYGEDGDLSGVRRHAGDPELPWAQDLCMPSALGLNPAAIDKKGAGQDKEQFRSGLWVSLSPTEALGNSCSATCHMHFVFQ